MASKCSKCDYYWDWAICAPYICPGCHEQTLFTPCDRQKGPPGRQPTPTGWICPHCKLLDKKLYYRGVCEDCYKQLNILEGQFSQVPLNRKNLPQVAPEEPKPLHTEPWACPECGSMWGPEVEKCRDCHEYCEGCKKYKPLYKGHLCKSCYDKYSPNKEIEDEGLPQEVSAKPEVKQESKATSIEEVKNRLEALEDSDPTSEEKPPKKSPGRPRKTPEKATPKKCAKKVTKAPQEGSSDSKYMVSTTFELTLFQYNYLKQLVEQDRFPSIEEALRAATRDLIFKEASLKLSKK